MKGAAGRPRVAAVLLVLLVAAGTWSGSATSTAPSSDAAGADDTNSFAPGWKQEGRISYYGERFAEKPTASGEPFDPDAMTMAHPTLPFGSVVRVTNLRNKRSLELRVNDRGPYEKGRIADVSRAAARKLGMLRRGVVRARIELLRVGEGAPNQPADTSC